MDLDRRVFLAGAGAGALALVGGAPAAAAPAGAPRAPSAPSALIRLDANENPLGPSPAARAAIREATADACRYPDTDELVAAIAARHGVTPQHVLLGSGSYGILVAAVAAAVRPGDTTVVPHPTFGAVERQAALLGPVVRVPLDRAARHDLAAMTAAVTPATRLVYVCNPNNPTGTVVDPAELRAFCLRHAARAVVLVDEAYAEYVPGFASMDALVREGAQVVVSRTFSKLYGLAGLRVGYAIAPPALADRLRAARGGADRLWVSLPGARAALASLRDTAFVEATRREVARGRDRLAAALRRLGLAPPAAHANFVYVPHPRPAALARAMADRGVRIAGGGPDAAGCRITIGLPAEMAAAEAALPAALAAIT